MTSLNSGFFYKIVCVTLVFQYLELVTLFVIKTKQNLTIKVFSTFFVSQISWLISSKIIHQIAVIKTDNKKRYFDLSEKQNL